MAVLTFNGAAQQVTGSCYLLESKILGRILLECGMHQGGDAVDRIQKESFPFDPKTIDALILSHAHLDHSGLIPTLVNHGFNAPIYCTRGTEKLLPVMLYDAAGLYERDLNYENLRRQRRGDKPLKPMYSKNDVKKALKLCQPAKYGQSVQINGGGSLIFHDAGHILGSAIVELKIIEKETEKTLVFSGDLGKADSVLMNDPAKLDAADIVLMEGTYGNRNHRSMDDTTRQLEDILTETWKNKGNVMIPAFAVGRTQEVLFHLGCLHRDGKLDNWQVFLDSPMAIEVTNIYDECIQLLDPEDVAKLKENFQGTLKGFLPRLRYSKTPEESMAINKISHGTIIIAGSGMCTGGRIRHHFKHRIWNQRNTIIFVGFQARGTLGRRIVDGSKMIKLFRDDISVRARIETLGGFSAHAGQSELIEWRKHFQNNPRTILIHGEPDALDALSMKLWQDEAISSEIPYKGQQIFF
ncbi:MBL fold metallo-hydrolase [Gammaproteobacteria bacterium]|nr:MBL fold metallo-hydrolase [Gammaproteobacteria bacterium]